MMLTLIIWIVSLLGIIGTVSFRSWQIKTGRIDPSLFDPEHENPLAPSRIEELLRKFFIAVRDHSRAIFIRVLHALALVTYRMRIKLDRLVRKMVARIEHEQGVLDANRASEQFLSTISEYKETLRHTAKEVTEEVRETMSEAKETVAEVVEVVKKPIVRRKRKPKIIPPPEVIEEIAPEIREESIQENTESTLQ